MAGIAPALQSGSLTSHQPPQPPPGHSEIWQWSSSHSLAPLTSSHSALAPAYRRSSAPHAPPPHSGIMLVPASLLIIPPPAEPLPVVSLKCCPRRRLRFIQSLHSSSRRRSVPSLQLGLLLRDHLTLTPSIGRVPGTVSFFPKQNVVCSEQ